VEPRRRFKFIKELAQGGFGKVYLAELQTGENFSSIVAIKLLHGTWTTNDEIVMRSRDEARLLGKLRHPNIVRVESLTKINGQVAVVMEYLKGIDLKAVSVALKEQDKRFPSKAIFEAIFAIARALDAAYTDVPLGATEPLAVIHRDIKPSNAMITVDGEVKVLDFGTARASFDNREAKTQLLSFGSQAYMAPERMLGEQDAPSGDIFSLGITLYELLTLDSFGKIPLRQERFEPMIAERIEALECAGMSAQVRKGTLDALRGMLAYEPTARPSAQECMELMEQLADQASDAGIAKFGRDTVKKIYEAMAPAQDPNDPYTGQTLREDISGVHETRRGDATGPIPNAAATVSPDDEEFRPPPELAEPPVGLTDSRPDMGVSAAAAYAAPPSPPRVTSVMPGSPAPGGTPAEAPSERSGSRPAPVDGKSSPRAQPSGSVSGATSAPTLASTTSRPMDRREPEEEASGGRGLGKILVALVVVGGLGLTAAGVGWFFLLGPGASVSTPVPDAPAVTTLAANLPKGTPDMDWSANQKGKGGAILRIPEGASEVVLSSSAGFRQEWDGSMNLRVRDVEPGRVRAKVKGPTGASQLTDFAVDADTTCQYTLKGGNWEKGECR